MKNSRLCDGKMLKQCSNVLSLCVRAVGCVTVYLSLLLPLSTFTLPVGVPVSSRVSTKIQQLLNTLKRPKRPPLSDFFTDDAEEIVEGTLLHLISCSGRLFDLHKLHIEKLEFVPLLSPMFYNKLK